MKTAEINIRVNANTTLTGDLNIPYDPSAFVIFSHGSGSSRFSTRNRHVAEILNDHNIATLLTDLLTKEEEEDYQKRFNIDLLTDRLVIITEYCTQLPDLKHLGFGYFGASTGAASALKAAARLPSVIEAVVCRGGRPDLAADSLSKVKAPTLLIVGSLDKEVILLNEAAYSGLNCVKEIKIIKGAGHLFEEPGKLDEIAALARQWFQKHLLFNPIINAK
jgi:putative phosphoribosyl transferase